jgi:multiple sugar transport system ATP-binding protein
MEKKENSVSIKKLSISFGKVEVLKELDLEINHGEFLVLLGQSGCGKSTLLNCIAGLDDVTGGQIFISGKNVTWAEPKDRGIAMVFQSYALYPRMTVEKNLSFGLRVAKLPKHEIKKRVDYASEMLQIKELLNRKPFELSGGQRQRVAIGRALVRNADVFLFDEPLSNLDAKLRADLRVELKRLHHRLKNTMIYVTHDQIEAMTLADRIAVMNSGVIQQLDAPHIIYKRPKNKFIADFLGSPSMNFLEGVVSNGVFKGKGITADMSNYSYKKSINQDLKAILGIRPEHIIVGDAAKSAPFSQEVTINTVEPMGEKTLCYALLNGQDFKFLVDADMDTKVDDKLFIGFDTAKASCFDKNTEERL